MSKQALEAELAAVEKKVEAFPAVDRNDRGDEYRSLKAKRDQLAADIGQWSTVHSDGEVSKEKVSK